MGNANYEDKRLTQLDTEKQAVLSEAEAVYDGMITSSDKFYQDQIDASKEYAEKQTQFQQEQTEFAIEQIQQQKDQAHQDYLKEQSAAYTDYQKQSNEYSVGAEQRAANGLSNTGYSESSQVAMYNAYQNRVAITRDALQRTFQNFDNQMAEARLQNNVALAQIVYDSFIKEVELELQGFQFGNQLLLEKLNNKLNISATYHNMEQSVISQINQEKALAEEIRQYNESMAEERRQFNETMAYNQGKSSRSSGTSSGGKKSSGSNVSTTEYQLRQGDTGTPKTTSEGKETGNAPRVDMASVNALGYGPISASKLDELVRSGEVIETEKNGVLTYKRANKPTFTEANTGKSTFEQNKEFFNNLPANLKKKLGL